MSVGKQLVIVASITLAMLVAWVQLAPHAAPTADGVGAERGQERRGGEGFRGRGGARDGRQATRVMTVQVGEAEAGNRLVAIGTGRAARSVTLYSQTGGIVSEIAFAPGDTVAAGDVLVRLDDAEQRIAVDQAKIALRTAQDTVDRYDRLSQSQAIAAVQAEEARAALARARTELAAAELALERRRVVAPFDGIMGFAEIEIGDMLSSTTPIANLDDRDVLSVEFNVPERFAAMIERGTIARATTAAYPGERFEGEVAAMDSRVDTESRTFRVRAALPNEGDRLRPGMAFSVTIEFDTPGRPAVPEIAVRWSRDGAYVWKVVDGRAQRTPVQVVARTGDGILLEGDIAPADVIVAEGHETLRDGAEIADAIAASDDPARL